MMTEPAAQSEDLKKKIQALESLRFPMGEDWYQESLARLRSGAKPGQAPVAAPAGGRTPWQLQNRQVALVDAYGNVTITGDNDTAELSPDEAPAYLVNMYYATLADECQRLPLGVIDQEFTKPGLPGELSLKNVYTDLDVVSPPPEEEEGKASRWTMLRLEAAQAKAARRCCRLSLSLEARRVVLLGLPGSGKTTFVDYVTYCLAARQTNDLPESLRLSWVMRLALRYCASLLPKDAPFGSAQMLWDALGADMQRFLGRPTADLALPFLLRRLAQEGGLVLLDGLDEVPEAGRRRRCLLEAVQGLQKQLPACRFLLTARPYAYTDQWKLPDFQILALAPFDQRQVEQFIHRWYLAVQPAMAWRQRRRRSVPRI